MFVTKIGLSSGRGVIAFPRLVSTATAAAPTSPTPSYVRRAPSPSVAGVEVNSKSSALGGYSNNLNKSLGGAALEATFPKVDSTIERGVDWYTSWYGIGAKPFDANVQKELAKALETQDIEVKPDGLIYLPEIKYRRILNKAFGAGGWGLVPRSETIVTPKLVTREYGLICHGQLVSVARGEQDYFSDAGIPTATEGCKSNALMRCCKDLGVGSELWDPVFIKKFKVEHCVEKFVEHITTKKKKKICLRKDRQVEYPYK